MMFPFDHRVTGIPQDGSVRNCVNAGDCVCNCCDKRGNKHCQSHGSGCHYGCSYKR